MFQLLKRKLKILLFICIYSIIAGILFQQLKEGTVDHSAFIIGFFMGLGIGIIDLFLMTRLDKRIKIYPIALIILIKTIIYTFIVYFISNALTLIYFLLEGKTLDEFLGILLEPFQLYLILFSLIVYSIMVLFMQISRLLGEGTLLKLIYGKYNKPVEEERIFMFLYLKS
jgi:adenylate cyclase